MEDRALQYNVIKYLSDLATENDSNDLSSAVQYLQLAFEIDMNEENEEKFGVDLEGVFADHVADYVFSFIVH